MCLRKWTSRIAAGPKILGIKDSKPQPQTPKILAFESDTFGLLSTTLASRRRKKSHNCGFSSAEPMFWRRVANQFFLLEFGANIWEPGFGFRKLRAKVRERCANTSDRNCNYTPLQGAVVVQGCFEFFLGGWQSPSKAHNSCPSPQPSLT